VYESGTGEGEAEKRRPEISECGCSGAEKTWYYTCYLLAVAQTVGLWMILGQLSMIREVRVLE